MARVDEKVNRTTRSGQYVVYIYVIFRLFEIYLPCIELLTDLGHSTRETDRSDEITCAPAALRGTQGGSADGSLCCFMQTEP